MLKKQLVTDGEAHAALVVRQGEDGEEAVAWAQYGPPDELPNIHHRKQYLKDLSAAGENESDYHMSELQPSKEGAAADDSTLPSWQLAQ